MRTGWSAVSRTSPTPPRWWCWRSTPARWSAGGRPAGGRSGSPSATGSARAPSPPWDRPPRGGRRPGGGRGEERDRAGRRGGGGGAGRGGAAVVGPGPAAAARRPAEPRARPGGRGRPRRRRLGRAGHRLRRRPAHRPALGAPGRPARARLRAGRLRGRAARGGRGAHRAAADGGGRAGRAHGRAGLPRRARAAGPAVRGRDLGAAGDRCLRRDAHALRRPAGGRGRPQARPGEALMPESYPLRLAVLKILVLSLVLTLGARLYYLQVLDQDKLMQTANRQHTREVILVAPRGAVVDDRGRPLVTNRTSLVVSVNRSELLTEADEGAAVLRRLSALIKVPAVELARRITPC